MDLHPEAWGRVVAISDCHFGEKNALLTRREVVEGLFSELEGLGGVDAVILLGDIWDLWRTGLEDAEASGRLFFRMLGERRGEAEVIMVPGNHDARLTFSCAERKALERMGWSMSPIPESAYRAVTGGGGAHDLAGGKPRCPAKVERAASERHTALTSPALACRCRLRMEGLEMELRYPFLALGIRGKRFLFMHGHHLDFFSRSFWWAKTAWLARWVLGRSPGISLSDVDRLNKPFFELLSSTAAVPELRAWEYRFYGLLRFLARLLRFQTTAGASPRRYTSVGENAKEAQELFLRLLPGYIPDVLVFGHTHRAGMEHVEVGATGSLLANCGCWLDDEESTPATYLVIDDVVRLRRLGDWEITVAPR